MISTVLAEHPWAPPLALLLVVVLGPVLGWLALRQRRAGWALLGLALLGVAVFTLTPSRAGAGGCEVAWRLPSPVGVESTANVVLLVPVALLAGVLLRRPVLAALGGSLLSVLVEALQLALPGLGRVCSTDDWLGNTTGSLIGALLAGAVLLGHRVSARRRPPATPAG